MNECMKTITLTKPLAALSLLLCSSIACEVPDKQIGQLDGESGTDIGDDSTDCGVLGCESSSDGGDAQLPDTCSDAIESLHAIFDANQDQRCALLVAFDYETFETIGWKLSCDDGNLGMSAAEAGALTTWAGKEISEPDDEPDDDRSFIFYNEPAGVGLGGVGWVSNHAGLLFDASISSDGVGAIDFPIAFADPTALGSGCTWLNEGYELRGYDLTRIDYVTDYQLPEGHVDALMDALMDTAVVRAAKLTRGGVFYLDFLAYPRTVDDFDPGTAEYMLVLEWWD